MKTKLLFLFTSIFFAGTMQAQTVANPAPDIDQCGFEIFDLTQQDVYILGNQNPADFTVAYFNSFDDANDNVNPITEPSSYIGLESEEIFARITNNNDSSYAVTSFMIGYGVGWVPDMQDVTTCNWYVLPTLQYGNYYTEPNGNGFMIMGGTEIGDTITLYAYYEDSGCLFDEEFTITIEEIEIPDLTPLIECDLDEDGYAMFDVALIYEEVLAVTNFEFPVITIHVSEADAANGTNAISFADMYNYTNITANQQTLYVRVEVEGCIGIEEALIVASDCNDNLLSGYVTFDSDNNGCDGTGIPATGVIVSCYNNGNVYYTSVNANGYYAFHNLPDGENNIMIEEDAYIDFTATPEEYVIDTPAIEDTLDFCLQAVTPVNDVYAWMVPTSIAMPGFQASYMLSYGNVGSLPSSGVISVIFDDSKLSYNSSTPSMQQIGNMLTFSYTDLQPFATGSIMIYFNVMQPPTANMGDVLEFTAMVDANVDDNPDNNSVAFSQVIINSYDPNDVTVREGEYITPEQTSDYLHYRIRFQNEGTANAQTVRIETDLDANLDWDTFMPMSSSHNYEIVRENGSVEFIFNNIDLAYTDADEEGSKGYIMYKIKPISTIDLGDVMEASAGIFFDFNEAVLTNTATTTVQAAASSETFNNNSFTVYPNPASDNITVLVDNTISEGTVTITDMLGKTVFSTVISKTESNLDISSFTSGVYFMTITAANKSATKKIVVK